ncbi:MAG: hypothetical protein NQU46_04460 [Methanolinea sp.]|nr:hypothetical protein [Methanolinea sp.]
MEMRGYFPFLVAFLVLILVLSGCITPPKEKGAGPAGPGGEPGKSGTESAPTPTQKIMDTRVITPATPYPTPTPSVTMLASSTLPVYTVKPTFYKVIYRNNLDFSYSVSAYSVKVEKPPLIIEMCLSPRMITRNVWYESRYTNKEDVYVTQTAISPASYFEIRVRDKASGDIIEKEGFGKTYSVEPYKVLTIRTSGDYLVEFAGNDISATVQMRVPGDPEPGVTPAGTLSCPS